jgi:glucokinase
VTGPASSQLAIGIDVGASKIAAALVDRHGKVVNERRTATCSAEGPMAVIDRMAGLARRLIDSAPAPVAGIGIGAPGYVDSVAGVVRNAVNLGWDEVRLVDELRSRLDGDLGVWAENDANVMALGEYHYGAAAGCGNFVYISIGSGLGSGIMVDHKLVAGAAFRAAELGHLSLDPEGRQCACGLRGCVETVVSGPGILTTAQELLASGAASSLQDVDGLTPEHVLQAAMDGDPLAVSVFRHTAQWLGEALSACVILLNPGRIVIGGGMGLAAFDLLVPGALYELSRRVVADSCADLQIVRSQVHSSAVGASSLVWHANQDRHAS